MENSPIKFFVGGIPSEIKKKDLVAYFGRYGSLSKITTFNPRKKQRLLGFCFVYFNSIEDNSIFDPSTTFYFHGRFLQIEQALTKDKLKEIVVEKKSRRLYIPQVPLKWTDQDLVDCFEAYGELENAFIVMKPNSKSKKKAATSTVLPDASNINQSRLFARDKFAFVIYRDSAVAEDLIEKGEVELPASEVILKVRRYNRTGKTPNGSTDKECRKRYDEKTNKKQLGALSFHSLKPTQHAYYSFNPFLRNREELVSKANYRFNLIKSGSSNFTSSTRRRRLAPWSHTRQRAVETKEGQVPQTGYTGIYQISGSRLCDYREHNFDNSLPTHLKSQQEKHFRPKQEKAVMSSDKERHK